MKIERPYLLFLGDVADELAAKTAHGIVDWRPDWCLGQLRLPGCKADCGLPDLSIEEAVKKGARTMVVGVVNAGGVLPNHWIDVIVEALDSGLDVATGLHKRLGSIRKIAEAAVRHGRRLHDVRFSEMEFATGKGTKRPGLRLLTVGTDCSVGKKYTALALEKGMRARGLKAEFRATGQTGVFISGRGVAIDAVVADFISGAAEWLTPANDDDHWDIVEGQGSLLHPSYAGVTLGLIHGTQPDALVLCHDPLRKELDDMPGFPVPDIVECAGRNVQAAQLTNRRARCVGVSLNTSKMTDEAARDCRAAISGRMGVPCVDPMRDGVEPIVTYLLTTD